MGDRTPARQGPDSLPAAACKGALAAGLPALAITSMVPILFEGLFPAVFHTLRDHLPLIAPYLSLGILFLTPAALAIPVAHLSRRMVRRLARRERDQGLAAAAGAGLASVAVTFGAILAHAGSVGQIAMMAPMFTAAALAVGVVGAGSFAAVPAESSRDEGSAPPVPSLYYGLMAAGIGGPALLAGGGLWTMLAWLMPFLSPKILDGFLVSPLAEMATVSIALAGLAPVSYLLARGLKRTFRKASPKALAAGLLFPPLVPLVVLAGFMASSGTLSLPLVGLVAGSLVGALAHLAAIATGLSGDEPGRARALPEAGTGLPLPASAASTER